jgi:nucleotide-binding universal stress UspA family protein
MATEKTSGSEAEIMTTPASSVSSQPKATALVADIKYNRLLVPHDGSVLSDKALNHAIYLSKLLNAEIVILNVLEHLHSKDSSSITATSKEEPGSKKSDRNLEIKIEGDVKDMIEQKISLCKQAGVESQVSYKIQTGKPVDEIVKVSDEMSVDLIVMASRKDSSLVKKILGSTVRKVMDSITKPVLVIHEKESPDPSQA